MKIISAIIISLMLTSCGNSSNGPSYIILDKSDCRESYYSDEFKTYGGDISVFIDCNKNEIVYFDIWNAKIIKRIPIK